MPLDIQEDENGCTIKVHLQPRAHKEKILGLHGDALKVSITAAPIERQANDACIAFFARSLKIRKGKIAIVSGLGSREKRVRLNGVSRAEIESLLPAAE